MAKIASKDLGLIEWFHSIEGDRNEELREAMVAVHNAPSEAMSSVERMTLAVTGSVALLDQHYQLEEKIREHIGQPLLIASPEVDPHQSRTPEECIGIIAGELEGHIEAKRWGQLVVPLAPVVKWGGGILPDNPVTRAKEVIAIYSVWGVDAEEEITSPKSRDRIESYSDPEGQQLLIGYEEIVCWEGLKDYGGQLTELMTNLTRS